MSDGVIPPINYYVFGMIRFGTGTSPHLFHALGDLLAYRGDKHLASRAYRRALQYNHPRPELLKEAIAAIESAVEHKDELSDAMIAREQAAAEAWVAAYQRYEDDLVRAGNPPTTEADYEPFYRQHGHARAHIAPADGIGNSMRKLLRVGAVAGALVGLLIVLALLKLWLVLRRRARLRAGMLPQT